MIFIYVEKVRRLHGGKHVDCIGGMRGLDGDCMEETVWGLFVVPSFGIVVS